jgi:hypothetical protein
LSTFGDYAGLVIHVSRLTQVMPLYFALPKAFEAFVLMRHSTVTRDDVCPPTAMEADAAENQNCNTSCSCGRKASPDMLLLHLLSALIRCCHHPLLARRLLGHTFVWCCLH